MVGPGYATTKLKDSERVLVCAKRMDVASSRIPTSPGRSNEVSGGCMLVVQLAVANLGLTGKDGLTSSQFLPTTVPHPTGIFEYS